MKNKFEFSEVSGGFDTHILNSIPGYGTLLNLTIKLSNQWINEDDLPIIDIGGSTGKLLDLIQKDSGLEVKNKFYVIDPTDFKVDKVTNKCVSFVHDDAQNYLKYIDKNIQICYSIFTLQFLSSYDRHELLTQISEKLDDDGIFFIAEKFYNEDSKFQELFSVILRDIKRSSFTDTEILDKDKKLLKHLKLKTELEFIEEMNNYNMEPIKYWQSLHFNGYVCRKYK